MIVAEQEVMMCQLSCQTKYPLLNARDQISFNRSLFIFQALRLIHDAGVLHGDLNPGNILFRVEPVSTCSLSLVLHAAQYFEPLCSSAANESERRAFFSL